MNSGDLFTEMEINIEEDFRVESPTVRSSNLVNRSKFHSQLDRRRNLRRNEARNTFSGQPLSKMMI